MFDMCAFFCVCVVLCLGRGLATSLSAVQGVLPSVNDQETEKSALSSKVGASSQMGAKKKKLYSFEWENNYESSLSKFTERILRVCK
jgi:ubiquinone biosynthesis protein Coq4